MFSPKRAAVVASLAFAFGPGTQLCIAQVRASDIAFVDETHGWVSVTEPTPMVLRTFDGGQTWIRLPVPLDLRFELIRFFDSNMGVAIQARDANTRGVIQTPEIELAIYRTVDGGQNWAEVNVIADQNQHLIISDAKFIASDDVLLVGDMSGGRGWVAELSDGGRTLRRRDDLPVNFRQQSTNTLGILGDSTGHLWIVGKELILHSADSGKTWENQADNAVPPIDLGIGGFALPGGYAWIAVASWDIYKTSDYGAHWVRAMTTSGEGDINFDSVSFVTTTQGCAIGDSALIYCTADGGVTWSKERVFANSLRERRSKLLLFKSGRGWASVGGTLYRTGDAGRSFTEVVISTR